MSQIYNHPLFGFGGDNKEFFRVYSPNSYAKVFYRYKTIIKKT